MPIRLNIWYIYDFIFSISCKKGKERTNYIFKVDLPDYLAIFSGGIREKDKKKQAAKAKLD